MEVNIEFAECATSKKHMSDDPPHLIDPINYLLLFVSFFQIFPPHIKSSTIIFVLTPPTFPKTGTGMEGGKEFDN